MVISNYNHPGTLACHDIHIMRHQDHGDPCFPHLRHQCGKPFLFPAILTACRFIQNNIFRMHGQRGSNGYALLIAPGQCTRIFIGKTEYISLMHRFIDHRIQLCPRFPC